MKIVKKVVDFTKELKDEFRQISWTSKDELISATVIVFIAAVFFSLYLALVDYVLGLTLSRFVFS